MLTPTGTLKACIRASHCLQRQSASRLTTATTRTTTTRATRSQPCRRTASNPSIFHPPSAGAGWSGSCAALVPLFLNLTPSSSFTTKYPNESEARRRISSRSSVDADNDDDENVARSSSSPPPSSSASNNPAAGMTTVMINHFHVLGLPVSFDVDEKQMKANYLRLMMDSHPDKRHYAATQDRTSLEADADGFAGPNHALEEVASLVTLAFDTLQKPHTRALHLLDLHNKPLNDETSKDQTNIVGSEFLMNIMEQREIISETDNHGDLQNLWKDYKSRIEETCRELSKAFEDLDLDRALRFTAELQYWHRIEETLRERLDTLE